MAKKALILIDIQNEYFENGVLELVNPIPASKNAGKLLERFREQNFPVVHIQHISPAGAPSFCLTCRLNRKAWKDTLSIIMIIAGGAVQVWWI